MKYYKVPFSRNYLPLRN